MPVNIPAYIEQVKKRNFQPGRPSLAKTGDFNRPGYLEIRERMGWHVHGYFPKHLFREKRPSEEPVWWEWRRKNYKPVTKESMQEGIQDAQSLFLENSNWEFSEIDEETLSYISTESFGGHTLTSWMAFRAFPAMIADPQAVIVVMPKEPFPQSRAVRLEAQVRLIDSPQILDNEPGLFSWEEYEPSPWYERGKLIYVIDDMAIFKIAQIEGGDFVYQGSNGEWFAEAVPYYEHETGGTLSQVLGGIAEYREGQVIYRSFFESFADIGDDVLESYSTFNVNKAMTGNPIREEYQRECEYKPERGQKCVGGYITLYGEDGETYEDTCPACSGTGFAKPIHPGHVIVKPRPDGPEDKQYPEISYIAPAVDGLQFQWEVYKEMVEMSRNSINLRDIKAAQSGEAKDRDHESKNRARLNIGNWFFGTVYENTLQNIVKVRRPFDWQSFLPKIKPPTEFRLRDSHSLYMDVKTTAETHSSRGVLREAIRDYTASRFKNQPKRARMVELEMLICPLTVKDSQEINMAILSGTLSAREAKKIEYCYGIIENLVEAEGDAILEQDTLWWIARVNQEFDRMFPEQPAPRLSDTV